MPRQRAGFGVAAVSGAATSLIETIGVFRGELRLLARHQARLGAAMLALGDREPIPVNLQQRAETLLRQHPGHDMVRVERRLPACGTDGEFVLSSRSRAQSPWARSRTGEPVRLLPVVGRRPTAAPAAEYKAEPRTYWDAVLHEARSGGADDGILLGDDGAVLETAVGNLWLLLDSVWTTPPLDGRVLPGIARALLLERAALAAIPVAERRLDLGDLHRAEVLVVSNAAFGPVLAGLVSARVADCNTSLQRLWRFAVGD